ARARVWTNAGDSYTSNFHCQVPRLRRTDRMSQKESKFMSDYDSPWKDVLDHFLRLFLAFFFPEIHAAVDWSKGYESLHTELQRLMPDSETSKRFADRLFRVWRLDGEEAWVLIHIEVQSQPDDNFAERMYVYNYRIYDHFHRPVVSLAVLGDDRAEWRPN